MVVEVDGLLHQPQPEAGHAEIEIGLRLIDCRSDVMEAEDTVRHEGVNARYVMPRGVSRRPRYQSGGCAAREARFRSVGVSRFRGFEVSEFWVPRFRVPRFRGCVESALPRFNPAADLERETSKPPTAKPRTNLVTEPRNRGTRVTAERELRNLETPTLRHFATAAEARAELRFEFEIHAHRDTRIDGHAIQQRRVELPAARRLEWPRR